MEYYSSFKKEGYCAVCKNMDESWWYYVKRNKPVSHTKSNAAWFYLHEVPKVIRFIESMNRILVVMSGATGRGKWGVTDQCHEVSVKQNK